MAIQLHKAGDTANKQIKLLLWGASGCGKTRFSTGFDDGFVIDYESGTASAANKDITVYNAKTARNFTEAIEHMIENESEYSTVIVDSLTVYGEKLFLALKQMYPEKKDGMNLWSDFDYHLRQKHDELLNLNQDIITITLEENIIENMVAKKFLMLKAKKFKETIPAQYDLVGYIGFNDEGKRFIDFKGTDERIGKNRYSDIGLPDLITEDDELFSAKAIFEFIRSK
jgi:hypothetical protein